MEKTAFPSVVEDLQVESKMSSTTTASANATVFHIYHVGTEKRPKKYSIHSVRDSETTILIPAKVKKDKKDKKQKKEKKNEEKKNEEKKSEEKKEEEATEKSSSTTALQTSPSHTTDLQNETSAPPQTDTTNPNPPESDTPSPPLRPVTGLKKLSYLDNPKYDPRAESAPYFIHLPKLVGQEPPYTLRYGGTKRGPVACTLHQKSLWQGWKLEFGDVLRQEGVIDGRGVVNPKYGTKKGEDGYLKGFKVKKRRWWGESGKAYWEEQKALGFPDNEEKEEEKLKADEVVNLKWASPFSGRVRDYVFEWRGFEFVWKGTRTVESKKAARAWVWCNHLKLVVRVVGEEEGKMKELCLVKYSCVMGNRKAGRVEVFEDVLDTFLTAYVFKGGKDESPENPVVVGEEEQGKVQQRLRDVIMGTMICMIITERDKRRFLLEFLQEVGETAGG